MSCAPTPKLPTMSSSHHLPNPRPPFLLYYLLLVSFYLSSAIAVSVANITGFSLKLIHRDSVLSPLFRGNLTSTQLHNLLLLRHRSRHDRVTSAISTAIQPRVRNDNWEFLVQLSIGTPATLLNLLLDTSSDISWTQCYPCNPCFDHDPPHYFPEKSSTYLRLPCSHILCDPDHIYCNEDHACTYNIKYGDDSTAKGVMSSETFTFESLNGDTIPVQDIVFGCTKESTGSMFQSKSISGILTLNPQPASFMSQISPTIAIGRFSYCLPSPDAQGHSYLSFGNDIVVPENPQIVSILPVRDTPFYYLDMIGISVGSFRLQIPVDVFALKDDGTSGTLIDSGSQFTNLVGDAYDAMVDEVNLVYPGVNCENYGLNFEDCFLMDDGSGHGDVLPPPVTFHFRGGDLVLPRENIYLFSEVNPEVFCLAVEKGDKRTEIGAMQQRNKRFIYDLRRNELSFAEQVCA